MKKGNGHRIRSLLYLPQKQGIEKYFKLPTHYSLHDFVQIAIGKPKKFVYFSAKLLSIFLTIYWKSVFRSVIMDYANMIYVMQTRHQFGR